MVLPLLRFLVHGCSTPNVCLVAQVVAAMESQNLAGGFVVPPLLRFLSAERAYLANAHGGPRMFVNIEDHLSWNTGRANTRFQARSAVLFTGGLVRF